MSRFSYRFRHAEWFLLELGFGYERLGFSRRECSSLSANDILVKELETRGAELMFLTTHE